MDHALVTETGESFLTHAQLVRHIREKCGDAIADYVGEFLGEDARSAADMDMLKELYGHIDELESIIGNASIEANRMKALMQKAGIE